HFSSLACQSQGGRRSDAFCAAGDQSDFAGKIHGTVFKRLPVASQSLYARAMPPAIIIRPANEADAPAVAKLAAALGYACEPGEMRRRISVLLKSSSDLLIVALTASKEPVGWLQAHAVHVVESGFRVEIMGLIVSAGARRLGVGRELVGRAEEWARSLGAQALVVRSNVTRSE